jgi:hypothetical protein
MGKVGNDVCANERYLHDRIGELGVHAQEKEESAKPWWWLRAQARSLSNSGWPSINVIGVPENYALMAQAFDMRSRDVALVRCCSGCLAIAPILREGRLPVVQK